MKKLIPVAALVLLAGAAAAQTTIQRNGNQTYINRSGGTSTVCSTYGNHTHCN